ncbi:MAG: T9SS type A sorting domain-containing protein [Saprospiraceae bacterium]|nr:T9SS type A sorting domain-containing protein [Saprospiraceae bacterium]
MKQYTLSLLLFFPLIGWAQPEIQWQRRLGGSLTEEIRSITLTIDKGYLMAGPTISNDIDVEYNNGAVDFWSIKVDSAGTLEWEKCYGGSLNESPRDAKQVSDGGFIYCGNTQSIDGDVSGNHGETDVWLIKTDNVGNLEWQKCYGGSDIDEGWEAQMTSDGGYIIVGWTESNDGNIVFNHGLTDVWVIKLDANAEIEWQKTYGGSMFDWGYSVFQTDDGGYIVCGEAQSDDGDLSGIIFGLDAWVLKLDAEGKIEWQREYGGSDADRANEILQTRDGGFIFCGHSESEDGDLTNNNGVFDIWVVKLSNTGDIEWQRSMGGSGQDNGMHIAELSEGGYVVTGSLNSPEYPGNHGSSDLWVIKLSESGEIVWQRAYGGSSQDYGRAIEQAGDGGLIVGGYTRSAAGDGDVGGPALGSNDFWILKLAPETSDAIEPVHPLLQIYPNPANTHIRVQGIDTQQDGQVIISDALGRIVMTRPLQTAALLELEPLPPGMYFLLARYADGKQMNGKFQKVE